MPAATDPRPAQPQLSPEAQRKLPALVPRKKRSSVPSPKPDIPTPALTSPPALAQLTPTTPSRRILSPRDHDLFLSSATYKLVLAFVFTIADSCADAKISTVSQESQAPIITSILSLLNAISALVDAHPAADQGASRFGNASFKDFFDDIAAQSHALHASLHLPDPVWASETSVYLQHAFGSRDRLDYGSGHELNFALWLLCLNRLSILPEDTFKAVALLVFPRYIALMRKVQTTYYLEPAGSHGVWGLDDFQFLPFLFGAAQLLHHPYIRPLSIHNELVVEEESGEHVYLDMIRWTVTSKTVRGLKWTQPMLDDISGAKNWQKVEQGMRRMFTKEVLGKLPVMQHFLFGTLVPADERMSRDGRESAVSPDPERAEQIGAHHHEHSDTWGDCCGIKIPSAVAAATDARRHNADSELRRIPFD